ncbi:MAG: RNA polymerase subunit sigma-70 [Cytophagaceae bacterium SCN 52-12]|nr:MAG: RNA polymerase subunit sigma-70 [Cytophagaceae bacterium SCN 52-12]
MLLRSGSSFDGDDFESLVEACIQGNNKAQRTVFKRYFSYVKGVSLRYCSSYEEAEDVLNESFLKMFQNLHRYDPNQPFKAWLRTIVINTAISYYRKNNKHQKDRIALEDAPVPRFEDNVVEKLTGDEIIGLLQILKPVYRSVFMLHVVDGYNHREIAAILDINEATVRSHYMRARARLQHLIKQYYPDLFPKDWELRSFKQNEN